MIPEHLIERLIRLGYERKDVIVLTESKANEIIARRTEISHVSDTRSHYGVPSWRPATAEDHSRFRAIETDRDELQFTLPEESTIPMEAFNTLSNHPGLVALAIIHNDAVHPESFGIGRGSW